MHLEDLGVYGKIILKWIFKTYSGKAWTGLILPKRETRGGLFEHGRKPSGPIKCEEFLG